MIDGAGSQTAVRGSSSTALEFCAEADSPLERTGFELAVPPRWTALRSEVVEEAFGSARYDERGRRQRPAASACSTPQAIPCVRRPILVDRVAAGRALK